MPGETGSAPRRVIGPLSAITLVVVAILGLLYVVSQFLRNSVGVIAPNLADEMHLTPIEIGLLSSMYFFAFAATQLPLGVALDRFGRNRAAGVCDGELRLARHLPRRRRHRRHHRPAGLADR
jgi:hypothetical protein